MRVFFSRRENFLLKIRDIYAKRVSLYNYQKGPNKLLSNQIKSKQMNINEKRDKFYLYYYLVSYLSNYKEKPK